MNTDNGPDNGHLDGARGGYRIASGRARAADIQYGSGQLGNDEVRNTLNPSAKRK